MPQLLKHIDNLFYFILFITALILVAVTPFLLLYGFSNVMSLFLQHVVGYRKHTTRKNLIRAFPEKSRREIRKLERASYRNLADIAIEALKGFTLSRRQLTRRYKIINPEILDKYYEDKRSVIGLTGHINNWEWGALSAGLQIRHKPIAFYKQLSNPYIDRLMKWTRAQKGTSLVSTKNTESTFEATRKEACIYLLVADQSPSDIKKAYWANFFGQDTACLHGPEKYGHLYNYPLIMINIVRVRRGYYTVKLSELHGYPESLAPGEITRLYMSSLESMIREQPGSWLWSHRRWKKKRPGYLVSNTPYNQKITE